MGTARLKTLIRADSYLKERKNDFSNYHHHSAGPHRAAGWTHSLGGKGEMKPTIEQILYSAKALLRELEQVDPDGVRYYDYEEAKYLERLIKDYEHNSDRP